jgi:hypothetical protein
MGRRGRKAIVVGACGVLLALLAAGSNAAIIKYGDLVLTADGEFSPHTLPRHRHAPVTIESRAGISGRNGAPPPKLEQAILDFDRDGLLTTKGLGVCPPSRIEQAGVAAARRICKGALVGTGTVSATVLIEGRWIKVKAPLSLFNGPKPAGAVASVVAHAQPTSLPGEIYVVTIPIVKTSGAYGYEATVEVPEIFNTSGVLTHVEAKIARRFRAGGRERSYISARCSDGSLEVHGHFTFEEGTVVDGAVEKYCVPSG